MITPERFKRMQEVLQNRTRKLTVVLEDIFQPHNASAVLRSCECFGVMDVHIIENRNTYQVNPDVALGASKWLNLHTYNSAEDNTSLCFQKLKAEGYRIIATTPHKDDCDLEVLPLDQPTALVFGNELDGLSPAALQQADGFMKIPMVGFTESLNISVSVAVCVHHLTNRLREGDYPWELDASDKTAILIQWIKNSLRNPERIEKEYLRRYNS